MFDDVGDVHHVLNGPVREHVGHGVLHLELVGGGLVLTAPQLDRYSILAHGVGGRGWDVVNTYCLSGTPYWPTVYLIYNYKLSSVPCQSVVWCSVCSTMAAQGWVWSQLKIVTFGVVNTEGGRGRSENFLIISKLISSVNSLDLNTHN